MPKRKSLIYTMAFKTDEKSTPQARAERLKRIRNMANLSRIEMCEGAGFSVETLKGWENARHGGLTQHGAEKAILKLEQAGVHCSANWLLYEIGPEPFIKTLNPQKPIEHETASEEYSVDKEKNDIAEELIIFRVHNPRSIHHVVEDDSMSPYFDKSDLVAGIPTKDFDAVIGKLAIVELENGETVVRLVLNGDSPGLYNLAKTNPHSSSDEERVLNNMRKHTNIKQIARIIWHRKQSQDNSSKI